MASSNEEAKPRQSNAAKNDKKPPSNGHNFRVGQLVW